MSQTEDSVGLGEMSQTGRSQQEQGTGAASVVLGADTAAQEWQVAYEGELSIRCAVAAEQGLYVGGFTMEGKARVEYLAYGSGNTGVVDGDQATRWFVYIEKVIKNE